LPGLSKSISRKQQNDEKSDHPRYTGSGWLKKECRM
jgi:hypothetical protein